MSVYVDEIRDYPDGMIQPAARRYGRRWCHMLADTEAELDAFAEKIGLRRSWHQPRPFPHYDLTPSRRILAVRAGAVEIDYQQLARLVRQRSAEARVNGAIARGES